MTDQLKRVLVIGYGNPGRLDDGLGPAFAEMVEAMALIGVEVEIDYQLNIEHAELIAGFDIVIFADAHTSSAEPFEITSLRPGQYQPEFTSHSVLPGDVLSLAGTMFHHEPRCYVLAIRGYQFDEFGQDLSPRAMDNLNHAVQFIEEILRGGYYDRLPAGGDTCHSHAGVTDN